MNFILWILGLLCLIIISKIISIIHDQYVIRQKIKNIPDITTPSVFGDSLFLMRMTEEERTIWYLELIDRFKNGIYLQWIGGEPFVYIFNVNYLEAILHSTVNIQKGIPYNMLRPWLGNGLLTSTGAQWFHDRKLIGPTFHFNILEQFAVILSEKAEILTKCLEEKIEENPGKAINIFPIVLNVTLDIICETAMGVNVHAQETETEYTSIIHRTSKLTIDRMIRPWYWINWIYDLTSVGKEHKSLIKKLHGFTKAVIDKKKKARQLENGMDESEKEKNESDIGKRKRKAFLDLLLDQNEMDDAPLTDDELRAQVDTFMFEGHDTTAVAITWALVCLGSNLEYQKKVHEELDEVFKDSQSPATMKELTQLKYLDRVIKETLRLYPSVPMITRKLVEDVQIDDYTLPKGITVIMGILFAHRNPEVWPNPEKFDPDRFLPENSKHRHPYAYIPFSAGPRNCIGQKFALLEEKIILTAILRKWSVESKEIVSYGCTLLLRPSKEVFLTFTPKKEIKNLNR